MSLFLDDYEMLSPALRYPVTVPPTKRPPPVALATSRSRVCSVTGILSPVVIPLKIFPIPMEEGMVILTRAPATGEKILFGVVELYICAV